MKALVTGANGFLGSALVRLLLDHGHEVRALVRRRDETLTAINVPTFHGDIRDYISIEPAFEDDIDCVFHTAAVTGIWGSWKKFHSTNTIGTRNIVQACLNRNIPKLVYTSSPSVTFEGNHQVNQNETAPYAKRWLCHYPHSKALAEQHVLDSNDPNELMTCALRPHLIWGPGDKHLIPRLVQRARMKQLKRVGDGGNQVDCTFVDNAAISHIQAAEAMKPGSPVCGSAYYITNGDPVNCWGFINEVLAIAGLPAIRKKISYYWAYRLGFALETYHDMFNIDAEPKMTRFLAAQLAKSHYFDIGRAQSDFNYRPIVSMEEGLKRLAGTLEERQSA